MWGKGNTKVNKVGLKSMCVIIVPSMWYLDVSYLIGDFQGLCDRYLESSHLLGENAGLWSPSKYIPPSDWICDNLYNQGDAVPS